MQQSKDTRIAILGCGNIGLSLAKGLTKANYTAPKNIMLTRRNVASLSSMAEQGYQTSDQNFEAVSQASVIIIAVLPQQVDQLLNEIVGAINPEKHLVVSVMSGVSCHDIRSKLAGKLQVVRAMPNTAIAVSQSITCLASDNASPEHFKMAEDLFKTVGSVMTIREELMASATAICACGIAFFLRAIRAASQGGVEVGFHAAEALSMAAQTAKGAAELLLHHQNHPEHEIDRVTSPNGCTIAGLNEMEHHGFSSSLIKGIKIAAAKANGLYHEA